MSRVTEAMNRVRKERDASAPETYSASTRSSEGKTGTTSRVRERIEKVRQEKPQKGSEQTKTEADSAIKGLGFRALHSGMQMSKVYIPSSLTSRASAADTSSQREALGKLPTGYSVSDKTGGSYSGAKLSFGKLPDAGMDINAKKDRVAQLEILIKNSESSMPSPMMGHPAYTSHVREYEAEKKALEKEIFDYERSELIRQGYRDPTFKDYLKAPFLGVNQMTLGAERFKEMNGLGGEGDRYEALINSDEYKYAPRNDFEEAMLNGLTQLGTMAYVALNPRTAAGAGAGAGTAFALGQAGPQLGTPEELVTVPSLAAVGMASAGATVMYEAEAGLAYDEMIKNGVSPNTARKIAAGVGAVNALIESAQIDELIDVTKMLLRNQGTKNFGKKMLETLYKAGVSVFSNTTEEVAQEGTTITGAQLANKIDKGEWAYTGKEVTERLKDAGKSASLSFGMMTAPSVALNLGMNAIDASKNTVAEATDLGYNQGVTERSVLDGQGEVNNSRNKRMYKEVSGESDTEGVGTYGRTEAGISEQGSTDRTSGESLRGQDSEGREINEVDSERIRDTVVKDEVGYPKAVYHYTPETEFTTFGKSNDIGFHFGSENQAMGRQKDLGTEGGRTFRVYLNLKKPIRVSQDIMGWKANGTALKLWSEGGLTDSELTEILSLEVDGYDSPAAVRLREILTEKGYDGIVYPNGFEGDGDSYIAFSDDQIIKTEIRNMDEENRRANYAEKMGGNDRRGYSEGYREADGSVYGGQRTVTSSESEENGGTNDSGRKDARGNGQGRSRTTSGGIEPPQSAVADSSPIPYGTGEPLGTAFGENGSKAFRTSIPNPTPEQYEAFAVVYNASLNGRELTPAQEEKAAALAPEARYAAEASGRNDADRAAQEVYFGKDAGLVRDDNLKKAKLSRREERILDALARVTGTRIKLVETINEGKDNASEGRGLIKIALDSEDPILVAALHEVVHRLRKISPENYGSIARFIFDNLSDTELARVNAIYGNMYRELNTDGVSEEIVAQGLGIIIGDSKRLDALIADDRTTWQKICDIIHDIVVSIKQALAPGSRARLSDNQKRDFRDLLDKADGLERVLREALERTAAAVQRNTSETQQTQKNTAEAVKYSVRREFASEIDAWDGKENTIFNIGTTSDALQSIGVQDRKIIWYGKKIAEILRKHKHMTREVIKQVPQIMENPVIVLKSQNIDSRIIMFGEVKDAKNDPVLAVLELEPTKKGGELLDMNVLASAYGKDSNPASFIRNSELLYLDPNKNRTNRWLNAVGLQLPSVASTHQDERQSVGLQLPSGTVHLGSIGTITYTDGKVNIKGVPYEQYMKNAEENSGKSSRKYNEAIARQVREELERMGAEYGWIPEGEKAAREVKLPKKTARDKHVSQTVRTILEAEATPEDILPDIEKMVSEGEFSYDRYTDKAAVADAEATIRKRGWEKAYPQWVSDSKKGKISKKHTALGWALYNNAVNAGDTALAIEILNCIVGNQRSAAQALQATRILKKLSPETQLYQVQRSIADLQEEINEKYRKDKAPKLVISQELAERFLKAETQEERDAVLKEIYADIGSQIPASLADKWRSWQYLAMLCNPRTHSKNILGNAAFAPVVAVKNTTATAIEAAVSFVTKGRIERTKSFGKGFGERLSAAWEDFGNVKGAVAGDGKYSDGAIANKAIEEGRRIFKSEALEKARRFNSRVLEAEDMWFSQPHYAFALAQYCQANGISAEQIAKGEGLDKARAYAIREAQKATYRDANILSDFVSRRGRKGLGKKANVLIDGALPFRKTPANMLVRGLEYSPAGLAWTITKGTYDVYTGEKTAAEFIDGISAGLTGTGLAALGFFLAAQMVVRGHGSDDERERELEELMGHQAYSLELPNGMSCTLDWLAPEALPFFAGVNLYEMMQDEKEPFGYEQVLEALGRISEPMLEMSCLQSLNDLFESVGYARSNDTSAVFSIVASGLKSYITQGIPSLGGQLERTGENVRYTTYTDRNKGISSAFQYELGKASAKIPGFDYGQIPYIDAWGRAETTGNAATRSFNNFINPSYVSQVEESDMEKELLRLYNSTGEASVLPTSAPKYYQVDGETKHLTADEYVKFATKRGQTSRRIIEALTESDAYKSASDSIKVDLIDKAYDYANQTAKAAVGEYNIDKWVDKCQKAKKTYGIPEEVFITLKVQSAEVEALKYDKGKNKGETIPKSGSLLIMEMIYNTKGLNERQREKLAEAFVEATTVRKYNRAKVSEELEEMRGK